jgi:hypothetical protein
MNIEQDARDLREADLSGEDLRGANLRRADLRKANLRRADLSGVNLRRADLRGARLYGANLYGADLTGADMYGADLRGARLYGANLYGANLTGADLAMSNGILMFGPVGNVKRIGYAVKHHPNTVYVQLGCFWGTQEEAVIAIRKKYDANSSYERIVEAVCSSL